MNWTPMGAHWIQSDHDYIVSKQGTGDVWLYTAWSTRITDGQYRARVKAYYSIGEPVPQWREIIGVYADAETAQRACEHHYRLSA